VVFCLFFWSSFSSMASSSTPESCMKRILFTEEKIQARVNELAKEIDELYKGSDKELVIVGVLKGAFMFLSDLARRITVPHTVEFLAVSSYGSATTSSGNVRIIMDTRQDITGKHVLLVEDIVDTGYTLEYLLNLFKYRNAASIECAVLLKKTSSLKVPGLHKQLKWIGFEVEPIFVVGYGLDYAERFRTLPYVGELKEEVYKK